MAARTNRKLFPQRNPLVAAQQGGVIYHRDVARNPKASYEEFSQALQRVSFPLKNPDNGYRLYGDYVKSPFYNPEEWLVKDYAEKQRVLQDKNYRNPNQVATLILFASFSALMFWLYTNGQLKMPWDAEAEKKTPTEADKKTSTTVKPSTPVGGSTGGVVSNDEDSVFPSYRAGEGIQYDDVVRAFNDLIAAYQERGYKVWPLNGEEVDPAQTISSVLPYKRDNWIPASVVDPYMFVKQYNHTIELYNNLPDASQRKV